jgi:hypothetical protein
MKNVLRKIFAVLGGFWIIAILILSFLAYFVTEPGPRDGLGRHLYYSPIFVRMIFGQDRLWPGLAWFIGDMVIFIGSSGLALLIFEWLKPDENQ